MNLNGNGLLIVIGLVSLVVVLDVLLFVVVPPCTFLEINLKEFHEGMDCSCSGVTSCVCGCWNETHVCVPIREASDPDRTLKLECERK